ncbi:MAG TPA: AsmA family protein [Candidatus Acidoferrales bacterium]|nr:AsmA family protein [Candidatus Acidoferrales bacterium]
MKKPLLIVGVIILLLIAIVLALPFFIDVNHFKPKLETEISKALGRQVQIGNIQLAIFSGGLTIDDVSIADDPSFSRSPFVTAKQLTVGVSLMPLIFSKKLEVRSFTLVEPDVTLLRSTAGVWNFSSLGGGATGKAAASKEAQPGGASAAEALSVETLTITNGRITIGTAGGGAHAKPQTYTDLNLEASDLSANSQFPFQLTMKAPGGGNVKVDGKAGPLDPADASLTPINAKVDVDHFDIAQTGFIDASSGLAGIIGFHGTVASDGHQATSQGTATAEKIKLVAAGTPASVPVNVDYSADYDLKRETGALKRGAVHIGKALANLTGSFDAAGAETTLNMKLNGQGMPVPDLEGVLPAVGVTLPKGATLEAGAIDASLAISGPVNKLVIAGPIHLSNGKLAGFNLRSKLGALGPFASALGGMGSGSDTDIQTLSADIHQDPSGTQAQNLNLVVMSIGSITGEGNVSADGKLDCKMVAKLTGMAGALATPMSMITGGGKSQNGGIPFKITGTTSNPVFLPDVTGMAGSMLKGSASTPGNAASAAESVLGGLLGKKKKPQQ